MSDTQDELRSDKEDNGKVVFHIMWFETRLGARYEMPDMLEEHITRAHKYLDAASVYANVVVTNISDATLVLPKRILKRAGVGERCFWETDDAV